MKLSKVEIIWPNGEQSFVSPGSDWLDIASQAGFVIPTGCLSGSCGACEIEVNGEVLRACINKIASDKSVKLKVELSSDPFW